MTTHCGILGNFVRVCFQRSVAIVTYRQRWKFPPYRLFDVVICFSMCIGICSRVRYAPSCSQNAKTSTSI